MATLDEFAASVSTQDTRKRLQVHGDLVRHLQDPICSISCEDFDQFIEGLVGWVNCSNYKVSLNGLEVLGLLVNRCGENFKMHVSNILPAVMNRLGDNKDDVREGAQDLLLKLMVPASSAQYVFDRIMTGFKHKLWRVREQVLLCLASTINHYGAKSLTLSKIVPSICKCLEDQSGPVRDAATAALVEIYRHVGERVRNDLSKKEISASKLKILFERFDQVKRSGDMLPTADLALWGNDDTDFAKPHGAAPKKMMASTGRKSMMPTSRSSGSGTAAGGVDESMFIKEFENVPKVSFFSGRELDDHMEKIRAALTDLNHDTWEKRVEALRTLRALMIAGAMDHEDFRSNLKNLESCTIQAAKDLRSQVVREACITLAYLAQQLGNKFDKFAEAVFPTLINLVPNSAKIMASSGTVCIRFIVQNTHAPRLLPIIFGNLSSKSSVLRRTSFELLDFLLHTWETHTLERHIAQLQDAIKKGLTDADSEARAHARKAFWGFHEHFQGQAQSLLNNLDSKSQKMLQGELSNSSSNNSIASTGRLTMSAPSKRTRSVSQDRAGSESSYGRTSTGPRRSMVPKVASPRSDTTARQRTRSSNSTSKGMSNTLSTPDRSARQRSRIGVSASQPGSRSTSPTSRMNYITYQQPDQGMLAPGSAGGPRRRSGIPRSQGASRETSPSSMSRVGYSRERRTSGSRSQPRPKGAQRVLGLGNVEAAEQILADKLRQPLRKRYDTYDSDDASETSSICSDRSYGSYSRASEYSDSGRRRSGYGKDVSDILANMSSSSWADRKEGLIALQGLLSGSRYLNRIELKKVTEIFTRMFHDPHGKVFSMFLETLVDFLSVHRQDLNDWLYILLTRLLNKMGSDMLGSIQMKVLKALDLVRESFPYDSQFKLLTKFIIDQTQTPNLKVKIALLNYLHQLSTVMDPSDFNNSSDTRLAISRIITWTTEPKSAEVRKAAQSCLIAMFNLNTPEFSMMLSHLPKTFQDGATKILHNHLRRGSQEHEVLSPRNVASPQTAPSPRPRTSSRTFSSDTNQETENMNPQDIFNSIKKTTADIQNLNASYNDTKKERDSTSQDSGIQSSLPDVSRIDSPSNKGVNHAESPRAVLARQQYNPASYQDEQNNYNRAALAEAVFDVENELFNEELPDQQDMISEILAELSNHNERQEERKNAMLTLIKMTREGTMALWDEHFKTVLLLLLETLGDDDGHIRALSLRTLREIMRHQPDRFKEYDGLTILKILEAHKDSQKEVVRAAEECAMTLAKSVPCDQCVRVLKPIVETAAYPINLAGIKMLTKVVEGMEDKAACEKLLSQMIPGLIRGYDNSESSVRKASVFCLVALYNIMGEDLKVHLGDLNGSKMKLLNLYIKRAKSQSTSPSKAVSPTSSDGGHMTV
ncbi:unnamed protein product [Owenia fusiformis]|uniref:Uncharacterized protein n=1 Tax=Owenia fusiformis TaxID=6347 RepID=A0A8J1Y069_OWEFU|nr:unnamed protein product [Owenia fusiformis]